MANCRHKHLQLGEGGLYGCIVCGRLFVAERAEADVAPKPVELPPEPAAVAPAPKNEPEPAAVASEPTDEPEPEAPPAPGEPEVDISQQLRVYLAGKPRQMPASARRRRKAKPKQPK